MTSRQTSDDSHTCAAAVFGTEVTGFIITSNHNSIVTELYGGVVLPNVHRPMPPGFKTDDIRRMICVDDA